MNDGPVHPDPQVLLDLLLRTREVERERIIRAVDVWSRAAEELRRIADGLDPHQGESFRHSWHGRAAEAATAAFDRIAANARGHAARAQTTADVLRAAESAVEDVSHTVFTEIGTKLQAEKRGGLFGGVVDWVEDKFDDQPDVDRDEQIERIHTTYSEYVGAVQTHNHRLADQFPEASVPDAEGLRVDSTSERSGPSEADLSPAGVGVGHLADRHFAAASVESSREPERRPARIEAATTSSSSHLLMPSAPPAPEPGNTAQLGLLGGGVGAIGAAGVAAGAGYGLARGRANAAGPTSPRSSRLGVAGSSTVRPAPGPVLGGATPPTPASGAVPPTGSVGGGVLGSGGRTSASPASGMVGAVGGAPPAGSSPKGPSPRYGPAPTLGEDPRRGRRRRRGEGRDILGPGSRADPSPPPPDDDEP